MYQYMFGEIVTNEITRSETESFSFFAPCAMSPVIDVRKLNCEVVVLS
jgi:hypothetical protein